MRHAKKRLPCLILISTAAMLLAIAAFGGVRPAAAQQPTPTPAAVFSTPGITLRVYPAFDGYFKYGEWLPIWVEVENTGADLAAEVRVQVSGQNAMLFTTPVELASGARKRLAAYVLPNNFSRQLVVDLVAGETRLASQRVEVNPQATLTYLAGLAAPERGALTAIDDIDIPGQRRPIQLVDITPADLPERFEGLRSFDLLVVSGVDLSGLTAGQLHALETWVLQGGRLVIGGGAQAQSLAAALGQTLLPLSNPSTQEVAELPGIETYTGADEAGELRPIRVPGPFVVASGKLAAGELQGSARILARQGDLPLVAEWRLDRGVVDFVALELSGAPFDAWNGTAAFWEELVAASAIYPEYAPADMSARQQFASGMVYPLSNLPMLDLPSVRGLALLLGLYILLVGPVNYLILRRRNLLHLAWITIPAVTLIFSAAAFGLGYVLHGTDVFINKIAVIQVEPSGRGHVDSFIGLFSPAQSAYEVQVYDSGLISPLNPYMDPWVSARPAGALGDGRTVTLVQGNPAVVRGLSVEQWSMQSFMSEGVALDFGAIEADLLIDGEKLRGEVRNRSSHTLQDAALVLGNKFTRLGDLAAGASASVELDLTTSTAQTMGSPLSYTLFQTELSGTNGPPPRQIEVRRSILENLLERQPPYISSKMPAAGSRPLSQSPLLIGWLDQAPPEVRLTGLDASQQTTAVVVAGLTYKLPDDGTISLPPGLIPGKILETPREGGTCGMAGMTAVYIVRGEAVFEFQLPSEIDPERVQTFKLNLSSDAGFFNSPAVSIYDFDAGDWLSLQGTAQGLNLIPASAGLIDDSGAVRIQLSSENQGFCYYVDLGLEGTAE